MPDARIVVTAGGRGETRTDVRGRFRLELLPGTYELRIYFPIYQLRRLRGIELDAGEGRGDRAVDKAAPQAA